MAGITRAQFLSADWRDRKRPVRPPWALAEDAFVERCNRCGDCVPACPTGILKKGRSGFPQVDFSRGECTFCGKCVAVCKPAALARSDDSVAWEIRAQIGEACFTFQRVVCRSCGERCEQGAIRFRPALGGVSRPELNSERCNGCGACVSVCPAAAISMRVPADEVVTA